VATPFDCPSSRNPPPNVDFYLCIYHQSSSKPVMLLLELPAILVEDIVLIAACDLDPYNACRLREVNRFFERVATKAIATHWLCRLTNGEAQNMLDPFRLRLIQIFPGDHDRADFPTSEPDQALDLTGLKLDCSLKSSCLIVINKPSQAEEEAGLNSLVSLSGEEAAVSCW
jgi:hypothetical protein